MEGASQTLILSVLIMAQDRFSAIMRNLGLQAEGSMTAFKALQAGAVGVGAGIIAIGAAANHFASDFQTQFAKISGLTGSSTDMIKYYKQQILELSPTFDMTATDAAKA